MTTEQRDGAGSRVLSTDELELRATVARLEHQQHCFENALGALLLMVPPDQFTRARELISASEAHERLLQKYYKKCDFHLRLPDQGE